MGEHTRAGSPQAGQLTDEFVDAFGIVGPPAHCIERLQAVVDLGVDKLIVVGPSMDADRDQAIAATRLFAAEVLPAIQAG
jgi:5,10-methylenetetrahydromethanopterin reductase